MLEQEPRTERYYGGKRIPFAEPFSGDMLKPHRSLSYSYPSVERLYERVADHALHLDARGMDIEAWAIAIAEVVHENFPYDKRVHREIDTLTSAEEILQFGRGDCRPAATLTGTLAWKAGLPETLFVFGYFNGETFHSHVVSLVDQSADIFLPDPVTGKLSNRLNSDCIIVDGSSGEAMPLEKHVFQYGGKRNIPYAQYLSPDQTHWIDVDVDTLPETRKIIPQRIVQYRPIGMK